MLAVVIIVSYAARTVPVVSFDATAGKFANEIVPIHWPSISRLLRLPRMTAWNAPTSCTRRRRQAVTQ
jgi:hypothetical protein